MMLSCLVHSVALQQHSVVSLSSSARLSGLPSPVLSTRFTRLSRKIRCRFQVPAHEALVIECRRAGDNPIEVLRVALGRHEGLVTALRATFKVRVFCAVSIVSDQPFARHDGQVYRAIAKIDFSLTVVEAERGAGLNAVIMSHVTVSDHSLRQPVIQSPDRRPYAIAPLSARSVCWQRQLARMKVNRGTDDASHIAMDDPSSGFSAISARVRVRLRLSGRASQRSVSVAVT